MPDRGPFADAAEKLGLRAVLERIAQSALTPPGRERVLALEPSPIFAEVRDELDRAREMLALIEADDAPPLSGMDDCRIALHRLSIAGSVIQADDWRPLFHLLSQSRALAAFVSRRAERTPLLAALGTQLFTDKMLEYHIDRVVDEEGLVRDGASKELRNIRREIIERSGQLRRKMDSILRRVSEEAIVQEDLITMRDGRMVLPVKSEFKRSISGFIHSTSATGQTVYIEPTETLDLNNEIRDLQFAELREIERILSDLTDRLRPHAAALLETVAVLAEFDSLHARARYGRDTSCSIPSVFVSGPIRLFAARHPVLLQLRKREQVVPLDLELGEDATTIVITGPNAGGKSVAMKTVGLLALMTQSGIPVPCAEASSLPVYQGVYVDIGDEQSVENDLSTFSSHVQRLSRIVENTTAQSLVLIDEIGTGTDPSEGSALGAAILEYLTSRHAHVIATTHHGMLKAFAHEHPMMENAAMEFDLATLQPTYRFRAGLPGSSYAFEITRRHGMRDAIIDRARELLGSRSDALEHLLGEVERRTQELAERTRRAEEREQKHTQLAEEYRTRLDTLKREAKDVRRQALEDAEKIVSEVNVTIEQTVREIREAQASKEAIQQAKQRIGAVRTEIASGLSDASAPDTPPQSAADVHEGDVVSLASNPGVKGTVLDEPREGEVAVAFGVMKMRVPVADLRVHEKAKVVAPVPVHMRETAPKNEIDIRGMYGDEAVASLDTWLYEAWSAGFKRVDIIHGKGTGALRKRVHEFLRTVPFVSEFRLGEWNEGSTGVTVVLFGD